MAQLIQGMAQLIKGRHSSRNAGMHALPVLELYRHPAFCRSPAPPRMQGPLHLLAGEAVEAAFANGWAALFTGAFICS